MRWLLLLLGLSLPVQAQVRVVPLPASVGPRTALTPALLGSLGDPSSPISLSLQRLSASLEPCVSAGGFDYEAAAARLEPLRQAEPLDRFSAGLLGRALAEPRVMERLLQDSGAGEGSPLRRLAVSAAESPETEGSARIAALAEASKADPEASYVFDGQSLSLGGLEMKKGRLYHAGEKKAPLGQGGFGVVYANPSGEGEVLKMTALSFEAAVFSGAGDSDQVFDADVAVAKHLSEKGLGPRLLGEHHIDGVRVAVKERVYGPTLQALIQDRKYGPEEHSMVLGFIARMAEARVRVQDMNPANLMLGRTLVDPILRVYHIDGGIIGEVKPHETPETLKTSIYQQAALFKQRMIRDVGPVNSEVALSTMLEEGLRRHSEKTFWQKLKGHFRSAYLP